MAGFGGACLKGSSWLGVLAAGAGGALLALLRGLVCSLQRLSDIAMDIAMDIALMPQDAGLAGPLRVTLHEHTATAPTGV